MNRLVLLLLLSLAACGPKPAAVPAPSVRAAGAVAKGVVEAPGGLVRILAPHEGVVAGPLAEEGTAVVPGEVLAQLDSRQSQLLLDSVAADLGERQAQVQVAAARAAGAEREADRLAGLAAADAVTRLEADQAVTAAAVARGEHRQAVAALRAADARRRLAAYDVDAHTVRAPVAGRIVRRTAVRGAYVPAGASLFVLEPAGARVVRAELDETFADRVTLQSHAVVEREFRRGQAYAARIVRISDVLSGPALAEDAGVRADTRVVSVMLSLPRGADLRLGERVLVRFRP